MSEVTTLEVLHPVAKQNKLIFQETAPRLSDLRGMKVGLYWNSKAGGDVALDEVARLLKSKYKNIEFENFLSASMSPATPEFMEKVIQSKCDAYVGSTAD